MWLLLCSNRGGQSYRLTRDKDHYVSRTVLDIVLSGDQSVSRKHAVFKFASSNEKCGNPIVTLTDLGSKYGTCINGSTKLDPHKPYVLQNGDLIKFGCQWNEWRFDSKPLIVVTSTLPLDLKVDLKKVISELGGIVVNDWQETCSHLTTTDILLTAKVVCALASAVPIVTPEYWTRFHEALEQRKLPPDHSKFIPPSKENVLNKNKVSFSVNESRKCIFSGKTFVFSTERQLKTYKSLIFAAGGKAINISDCNWTDEEFCKPHVILMQHTSNFDSRQLQPTPFHSSVLKLLRSTGGRAIPESEIGLAILMCSLDRYCNPQYNVIGNILQGGAMVNVSQLKSEEVWAADTPSVVGDASSVKIEEAVEEKSFGGALSVPESGSLAYSSCNSDANLERDEIYDDETDNVPQRNKYLLNANSTIEVDGSKIASAPSRKRIASNKLKEPAAKKVSSEEINSCGNLKSTQPAFEVFNYTDLIGVRMPRSSQVLSPNVTGQSNGNRHQHVNDSCKRKYDNTCSNPHSNQLLKKKCMETSCLAKQSHPDGTCQTSNILKEQVLVEPELLHCEIEPVSKTMERLDFSEHCLEKSDMIKEGKGLNKELEIRNIHEQETFANCHSSPSREIRKEKETVCSKLNGASSERNEVKAAIPSSTSKAIETTQVSMTEEYDKKAVERRGICGMGRVVIDMVVKVEALVIDRSTFPVGDSKHTNNIVTNFKKFKKVRSSSYQNVLPQIIGESDLMIYEDRVFHRND